MDAFVPAPDLKRCGYCECRIPGESIIPAAINQLVIEVHIRRDDARLVKRISSRPDDLSTGFVRLDFKLCGCYNGLLFGNCHVRRAVGIRHPESGRALDAFLLGKQTLYVLGVAAFRLIEPGVFAYTLDAAFSVDSDDDFRDAGNLALRLSSC